MRPRLPGDPSCGGEGALGFFGGIGRMRNTGLRWPSSAHVAWSPKPLRPKSGPRTTRMPIAPGPTGNTRLPLTDQIVSRHHVCTWPLPVRRFSMPGAGTGGPRPSLNLALVGHAAASAHVPERELPDTIATCTGWTCRSLSPRASANCVTQAGRTNIKRCACDCCAPSPRGLVEPPRGSSVRRPAPRGRQPSGRRLAEEVRPRLNNPTGKSEWHMTYCSLLLTVRFCDQP